MRLRPSPNIPARGPVREDRPGRRTRVGDGEVRRLLPSMGRRSIGAWCFVDHFGPNPQQPGGGIGPHPHAGLQTVTWLLEGAMFHHDSLGSAQHIAPGQLNWMTSGRGIVHAETSVEPLGETSGEIQASTKVHGVQLWVALPEHARHVEPSFEHYAALPRVELTNAELTVMVGSYGSVHHEVRSFTPLFGAQLLCTGGAVGLRLDPQFEHAVIVLEGEAHVAGTSLTPGTLRYLGIRRDRVEIDAAAGARLLVLGGEPLREELLMWWNFVGREDAEIRAWREAWATGPNATFGAVSGTSLSRIDAPRLG